MRILALDLALHRTGWAAFDGDTLRATGVIDTAGQARRGKAYIVLTEEVRRLLANDPEVLVVESPRWLRGKISSSIETMEAMLGALAIVEATVAEAGGTCRLVRDDPSFHKQAIAGNARATKAAVRKALAARGYPVAGKSYDETDAMAIALAWWLTEGRFSQREPAP